MVRKAEFDENTFILSAIELVSLGGPSAATIAAIAESSGAPTGSIYHRFTSRNTLLATAWHHALSSMADLVLPNLLEGNNQASVSALIQWAEENPHMARLVMLYSENDLIDGALPNTLNKKINDTNKKLAAGLSALITSQEKPLSAQNIAIANFAIFDGPIAAIRPILRGKRPSSSICLDKIHKMALSCCHSSLELLE